MYCIDFILLESGHPAWKAEPTSQVRQDMVQVQNLAHYYHDFLLSGTKYK